jgi:AraC-like DNA-binding protein
MYGTVRILRNIIYAASARGASLQKLCSAIGITPKDLNDADRKIEGVKPVIALWNEVIASTGDPLFGLHIGRQSNPSGFGLLGFLLQTCRTVADTFWEIEKYQGTVSGWIKYRFEVEKACEITYTVDPLWVHTSPETARQAIEMAMSGVTNYLYVFTNQTIYPLRAELAFPQRQMAEYECVLGCPVTFDCEKNRLFYPAGIAGMQVVSYDASLHATLAKTLSETHAELGKVPAFDEQVRQAIVRDFMGRVPSLEIMAAHLNVSERSLQRKLKQHNESYRSLGIKLKKELAINLLQHTDATVHTISDVLGYTDPSGFHRAFKSWTHTTPVRKKQDL